MYLREFIQNIKMSVKKSMFFMRGEVSSFVVSSETNSPLLFKYYTFSIVRLPKKLLNKKGSSSKSEEREGFLLLLYFLGMKITTLYIKSPIQEELGGLFI